MLDPLNTIFIILIIFISVLILSALMDGRILGRAIYVLYPPNFYLLFFLLFFLAPSILYILDPPGLEYRYTDDGYPKYIWLLTVVYGASFSLISWYVARRVCGPQQFISGVRNGLLSWGRYGHGFGNRIYRLVFWVIPAASLLFLLLKFGGGAYSDYMINRTAERKGMAYLIMPSLWLYIPIVMLLVKPWLDKKKFSLSRIALICILVSGLTISHLYLGSKSRGLVVIIYMLFCFVVIKGFLIRTPLKFAALALVVGVGLGYVGLLFGDYREAVTRGAEIEDIESRGTFAKALSSLNAVGSLENTAWVIQNVDANQYSLGAPFLAIFTAPIPRGLWPEKPVGGGPALRNLIHPGSYDIVSGYQLSSYSPGFLAESYMSFGFFGLLIIAPLYGYLLGWYGRLLGRIRSDVALVIWPIGLYSIVYAMTGEVFNSAIKILMLWVPFWLCKGIAKFRHCNSRTDY